MNEINLVDVKLLSDYISERGGRMSHLKLQKLLYYTQAFHLAYFDEPLIEDEFQAWLHGPVCRALFNRIRARSLLYTEFVYIPRPGIFLPSELLPSFICQDQLDLINEVVDGYAKLSAKELEALTHADDPWIDAREGYAPSDHCENVISKESMRLFYKKFILGKREE